jgi:TetR/AcrR family tetracycline transcriptional repressor
MPLRRDQVVRAALELLDEVGLDAFTTRALTDRLGVQRGALYWHVRSKRELLTAVAELITAPVFEDVDAAGGDWADRYAVFAHRLRAVMLAHRDGARLVAGHIQPRAEGVRRMEATLRQLADHGIPPEMGARFGDTMASSVTGYVLQEQAMPSGVHLDLDGTTPLVAEAVATATDVFAASVRTIVLGMRAEVAALRRP